MNALLLALLKTSLFMSAAILLLTVLSRLLHKKTSPAARMACWLAVAVSLLVPVRPQLFTLTAPAFVSSIADTLTVQMEARAEPDWLAGQTASAPAQTAGAENVPPESAPTPVNPATSAPRTRRSFDVLATLPYLWAMGFLSAIMLCAVRHVRFLRTLKRWGQPVSEEVSALLAQVRKEVGLKRRVRLRVTPVIVTPVLVGLFRPVIVLPSEKIEESKLRLILMHEALHCKRGDIWAKALSLLAVAVHWFNPLVYLMNRAVVKESEAVCDRAVLRYAGADQRFQYGQALLYIAGRGKQSGIVLSSAFNSDSKRLKKRLVDIVERADPKRWVSASCAAALFAGLLLPAGLTGFQIQPRDIGLPGGAAEPVGGAALTGEPTEMGLKDIYADYFLLGTSGNLNTLGDRPHLELVNRHFNAFTIENEMKPNAIQREEGRFDFTQADQIAEIALAGDIAVVGHTLTWHQQTPKWMWDDRTKAKERLEAHIDAVIRHSGPYLTSVDVVNEAFTDSVKGLRWKDDLRQDGWYTVLGAEYIEIAFRKADQVRREIGRPDLKLYYNDCNLNIESKAQAVYQMVTELRGKGVPVDGVGMQAHYNQYIEPDSVRCSLELFSTIPGIEISISELDIAMADSLGQLSLTQEQDARQGALYARLFSLFKEYAQGPANPDMSKRLIARVTVWGTTDEETWRSDRNPMLFDREFNEKSAYYAAADPERYLQELQ